MRLLGVLLASLLLQPPVHAVDKIRIGIPDFTAQFGSLPLGQKRGFLKEEDLQGEVIRMNATVGLAALAIGEIDYYTVIGPGVAAAIQGVPIKIVACYVPSAPFVCCPSPRAGGSMTVLISSPVVVAVVVAAPRMLARPLRSTSPSRPASCTPARA